MRWFALAVRKDLLETTPGARAECDIERADDPIVDDLTPKRQQDRLNHRRQRLPELPVPWGQPIR